MSSKNIDFFIKNSYVFVKNALNKDIVKLISDYALFDEIQNYCPDPDDQVVGVHSKYADPAMESMLIHLLPILEKNTGLNLIPTYSFYRIYRNNSYLQKHKNKNACEISCSVSFNKNYSDEEYKWPFYIDGQELVLNPGDLVVYRGMEKEHWRNQLITQKDVWHIQGFFYYVDADGKNKNYAFDNRDFIGQAPSYRKGNLKKTYLKIGKS